MSDDTRRWLALITNARTSSGLEWLERSLVHKEQMTTDLRTAVDHRRAELKAEEDKVWRNMR